MTDNQKEIMEIIQKLSALNVYRVLVVAQTLQDIQEKEKAS